MGVSVRRAVVGAAVLVLVCACSKKKKPLPTASATAKPSAAPGAKPPAAVSPYAVLARSDEMFVVSGLGKQALLFPGGLPLRADEAGLHEEGALVGGLGDLSAVGSIYAQGSFPDAAFVDITLPAEDEFSPGPDSIFIWRKKHWVNLHAIRPGESLTAVVPWKGERYIGVVQLDPHTYDFRFALLHGKGPVALPDPGKVQLPEPPAERSPPAAPSTTAAADADPGGADGTAATGDAATASADAEAAQENADDEAEAPPTTLCRTPLVPSTAAGLPDGHLFLLGNDCLAKEKHNQHWKVQRWSPDSRKATIDELPAGIARSGSSHELEVVSPNEAYVTTTGPASQLARFDGKAWKMDALPPGGNLSCLIATPDGPWAVVGKKVYRRKHHDKWQDQMLPPGPDGAALHPVYLVPRSGALPWVIAKGGGKYFLLGAKSAPPKPVADLPVSGDVKRMFASGLGGLLPASGACDSLFVLLQAGVGAGQKSFKVLDALKGKSGLGKIQIVIDDFDGQLLLGATVPDMATGKRVVSLVGARSRVARVACHAPKVKKKLEL